MMSRLTGVCVFVFFGALLAVAIMLMADNPAASASPEPNTPLDCLSCHPRNMDYHDKLGAANKSCYACHDKTDMQVLRMLDDTLLPLDEPAPLCGQCHAQRYQSWLDGTHGFPPADLADSVSQQSRPQCSACHSQHNPQIVFANITLPRPPPQPAPRQASPELLIMLGTASLLLISIGIVVVNRIRS
ncbi:MAG: hypothetical protein A2147_04705 [Chloroflexi bacterium RBG_16_57_8]|nr:MAG: hypothetical protein A2147_04705 [Chloroflexi bacterium RBG_16_57_8]